MEPASESPLLLPANSHKQLVVIDFEYSSANVAGLEFANHFVSPVLKSFHRVRWPNYSRRNGVTTITMRSGPGLATTVSTPHPKNSAAS